MCATQIIIASDAITFIAVLAVAVRYASAQYAGRMRHTHIKCIAWNGMKNAYNTLCAAWDLTFMFILYTNSTRTQHTERETRAHSDHCQMNERR